MIKDKTFFFGDYQGTRQQIARVRISTVPTLAQHQGNFASSLGALLFLQSNGSIGTTVTANPVNVTDTNGNTVQARVGQIFRPSDHRVYAGNLIPINTFDPVAAELLKRYPNPTSSGAANNFTRIGTEDDNRIGFCGAQTSTHLLDCRSEPFNRSVIAGNGIAHHRRVR